MTELNLPSPVQHLESFENGVELFIKRDDLLHPRYGGNKWRKLKYNIQHFQNNSYSEIISFGGAFSNHIYALAQICRNYSIPCVGLIRGEIDDSKNPTLREARNAGMRLIPVSRTGYRNKENDPGIQSILQSFENPYLIPEGGSNQFAKKGVMELYDELGGESYDYIFVAAGTGMTAAGIVQAAREGTKVIIVNALKNPSVEADILANLNPQRKNWQLANNYHFGGFAKVPDQLRDWYLAFYKTYKVPLDPVYNAKAMYALMDMIKSQKITSGSKVLYLHTGGLQGIRAFEYLKGKSWPGLAI